jgi:hypothetical protein
MILEATYINSSSSLNRADVTSALSTEEQALKESFDALQKQLVVYELTSRDGDNEATATETEGVAKALRNVGIGHRS